MTPRLVPRRRSSLAGVLLAVLAPSGLGAVGEGHHRRLAEGRRDGRRRRARRRSRCASAARARSGCTSASPRSKDADGVICTDESIGRASKKGSTYQYKPKFFDFPEFWLNSPGHVLLAGAPDRLRRRPQRLPPGGPDHHASRSGERGRAAGPHRLLGLAVPRLARALLPAQAAAAAVAGALRVRVRDRRGQQHLLPAREAGGRRALGRRDAARTSSSPSRRAAT